MSTWIALFLAKLIVSAGIVIGITAAVERLGPRLGALIGATPQLSVVALVFFTIEQGPAFAAESAFWTIPGMCATIPVFLGYIVGIWLVPAPRLRSVLTGVGIGSAAFVVGIGALGAVSLTRWIVVPLAAAVCFLAAWIVRRLPDTAVLKPVALSPAILVVRAAASAITVVVITSVAHALGPKWSGLVASFPVNGLPVMALLHYQYGSDIVKPFVRIFPVGAFGICLFNLVVSLALVRYGFVATLLLAYTVDLVYLAGVATVSGATRR